MPARGGLRTLATKKRLIGGAKGRLGRNSRNMQNHPSICPPSVAFAGVSRDIVAHYTSAPTSTCAPHKIAHDRLASAASHAASIFTASSRHSNPASSGRVASSRSCAWLPRHLAATSAPAGKR